MDYDAVLAQVVALLQREQRLSYRVLKLRLQLDDDLLEALKEDLIYAKKLAVDEDGRVLVWTGGTSSAPPTASPVPLPATSDVSPAQGETAPVGPAMPDAERRQLTVMFCDLVDSTRLSSQLDPEEYRDVVRAYQAACTKVIQRYGGHIAQLLGDGLLIYFGYPLAHEDDAHRAVRTGLGILEVMGELNQELKRAKGLHLALRLGIHTGLVVVGDMGSAGRQEQLALGETPNIAARLQGLAAPDTVVISAATQQLIQGYFTCHPLGSQTLKGVATPLQVYQVERATEVQQRFDVAAARGLAPLVGREHEVAFLRERWAQVQEGRGHIVLLSGEAGIGKSRLVQVVKDEIIEATTRRIEYRCSAYHQHSAFYPIIAHLERVLALRPAATPEEKLRKLEDAIRPYPLPLAEVVPLLAALLAVPLSVSYAPLALTPQRQKQKTLEALLTWLLALTEQQPLLFVVEDLHWVDPSTLEFLTLLVEQGPTARLLALLTYRPEFQPPWGLRTHLTPIALQRLPQPEAEALIVQVTGGKALPPEVVAQIVAKTDGVPLFVEELTKAMLESGLLRETAGHYALTGPLPPLAIPTSLHDSLMARLDRLAMVKAVAQLGAVIGRTFAYELLQAVSPLDAATVQHGLRQLVEAELVYQRGVPPHATYMFKHALIQDAAYQSLLRSTRQQYHQRLAQVLAEQFPATAETHLELLAHHYTAAGLMAQAIHYWQHAGRQALQRSANLEAVQQLTTGLALLATLPEAPTRTQQELDLHMALAPALIATKGPAALEVEQAYARARVLCQQVGETPQLFPTLRGLCWFYRTRGALLTARELGEQLYQLAQREADPTHLLEAHDALGSTLFFLGEYPAARAHLEQALTLIDPTAQRTLALRYGVAPGVWCLAFVALTFWCLGYPVQAMQRSQESLAQAQALAHTPSLLFARYFAAFLHYRCRDAPVVQAHAEALLTLATAQEFPLMVGYGIFWQGLGAYHARPGHRGYSTAAPGSGGCHGCGGDAGTAVQSGHARRCDGAHRSGRGRAKSAS
jgi:class 3 adenylate cyclase/tetratricopeptide (TPR) repeat protein